MAAPTPALAQISSQGGPISYSADNLEYTDNQRQLVLTGNVDVVQSDSRLQSDKLTLFFKPTTGGGGGEAGAIGTGDIERIIAEGQVYYVRPEQKARGDRAVYDVSSDSVTFTGNVVVASTENVIRGETLVLEISGGRTTIAPSTGARVQGVFRPKQGSPSRPQN
ncbi:MAG: LptA/OstA family protein [Hyphomonadaceae bacterium]|nr:LptA/OstA family protein [Hyphomonadaceae bacterium]